MSYNIYHLIIIIIKNINIFIFNSTKRYEGMFEYIISSKFELLNSNVFKKVMHTY